jgi:hypothetical protein
LRPVKDLWLPGRLRHHSEWWWKAIGQRRAPHLGRIMMVPVRLFAPRTRWTF